jgi:hypothetical protein
MSVLMISDFSRPSKTDGYVEAADRGAPTANSFFGRFAAQVESKTEELMAKAVRGE